ncbi:STAS domain-containing protein [Solwaraspora sp. WMMD406]|uniref:STAS domain-containing protein n=1 Tax=Solwaraspora sp. WMMD406 TaxID=3016095 RepID=UPI0024174574|nr:STAS domain-containing protein [Solwaraspora sp. WMMD406]MDG4766306.1 STAS domain-containing protein [Solwaraspora sp. WMMD406]
MTVDTTTDGQPVLRLSGDLDFQTATTLREQIDRLMTRPPTRLVLSFAGLRFIDSTGLAVLVHAWRLAHPLGTRIELSEVPAFLASVLDITGVGELVNRPAAAVDDDASTA